MSKELEYIEEKYGSHSWQHYPPSKRKVALWLKEWAEKQLILSGVSKSVAKKYAEFCVECDRKGLPLLLLDDYIEQYCC